MRARAGGRGVGRPLHPRLRRRGRGGRRRARRASCGPALRFAVGVHPHEAARVRGGRGRRAASWSATALGGTPGGCAIGEIGLDYHYDFSPRDVQRRVFRAQIALARETGLPVVIHTREADDDTMAILREEGGGPGPGRVPLLLGHRARSPQQALDLGFMLSFSGIVTFPKAEDLRAVAASRAGRPAARRNRLPVPGARADARHAQRAGLVVRTADAAGGGARRRHRRPRGDRRREFRPVVRGDDPPAGARGDASEGAGRRVDTSRASMV